MPALSRHSHAILLFLAPMMPMLGGCVEGFETRPAYADERFLCGDEGVSEYQARAARCRESSDGGTGCSGVLSFKGTLEKQAVVLDTDFSSTEFALIRGNDGELFLDDVESLGDAPYFQFRFRLDTLGGLVDATASTEQRSLAFDPQASRYEDKLTDTRVKISIRLAAGGQSKDFQGRMDNGTVLITTQSAKELAGSFNGAFGAETDSLAGCFHVFASKTTIKGLSP
ncbi:MAG: hypothetical protein HY698_17130 [Deltaproteobacteria bacterium]|nr:hypothetical protein [Deltaproteobacteria bacterium]